MPRVTIRELETRIAVLRDDLRKQTERATEAEQQTRIANRKIEDGKVNLARSRAETAGRQRLLETVRNLVRSHALVQHGTDLKFRRDNAVGFAEPPLQLVPESPDVRFLRHLFEQLQEQANVPF